MLLPAFPIQCFPSLLLQHSFFFSRFLKFPSRPSPRCFFLSIIRSSSFPSLLFKHCFIFSRLLEIASLRFVHSLFNFSFKEFFGPPLFVRSSIISLHPETVSPIGSSIPIPCINFCISSPYILSLST